MSIDLKPFMEHSYPYIIKGSLDRILLFESDSIMNHLIRLHISQPENADEKLVFTDKFYLYKNLWKAVLEILYEKYLPNICYTFEWNIEITPYTLMLCDLSKEHASYSELERQKEIMNLTDSNIENDFDSIMDKAGLDKIGIIGGLKNLIPDNIALQTKKEEFALLLRLMNFPPLAEIAQFLNRYNAKLKNDLTELSVAFSGIKKEAIPNFGMSEPLHYSWLHVDHLTFKKYGLDSFEQHPDLQKYKSDFDVIRKYANDNIDKFKDETICPCCGEKQEIKLPEDILHYKCLLENQKLCREIGLLFLDDFSENYKRNLSEKYYSFLPNINRVDNPDCLILVEGESEEASLPLLGFRSRFILSQNNIQVYNSKSKEKLAADFLSFKANYPNRKMICLLDSDAVQERDDIQRIANDNLDKYRVVFIEKGTFEDVFNLDLSIEILNEMYPEGDLILKSDFEPTKDFLSNIKKILFFKKKAQFYKVLFAKKISLKIDIENLPEVIKTIFDIAKAFTEPKHFISKG